jgi:DNA recombination protein RmuC
MFDAKFQHRTHIKALAGREYQRPALNDGQSADFVVLFLPEEGLLRAAFEKDASLLEFSIEHKVLLASPMTMVAVLRAISLGWQQEQNSIYAEDIAALGSMLFHNLVDFSDQFVKVGRHIGTLTNSYNDTVKLFDNRILPPANKLRTYSQTTTTGGKSFADTQLQREAVRDFRSVSNGEQHLGGI